MVCASASDGKEHVSIHAMKWDPYEYHTAPEVYRWLRNEAPVYKALPYGFYALSRHADVSGALLDPRTYSSRLSAFPKPEHLPVIQMDDPKHAELRAIVIKPFLPREVAKLEHTVLEVVTRRLDGLAAKPQGDLVTEFAELVPSDVIGGILGVPAAERPLLGRWATDYMSRDAGNMTARSLGSIVAFREYFSACRREREVLPRNDLLTSISQATVRGSRLSDADYGLICAMLAIAGYETTTNLICHVMLQLAQHAEQREWLRQHPDYIPNAVKEAVRYCSPTTLVHRVVTCDVNLHGTTIPRGAPVGLILAAASRDERHYPDPDRFDIRREDAESLGFGQGRHACFGAPLARLETRVVLEQVLRRFPHYEVDASSVKRSDPGPTIGFERMEVRLGSSFAK